MNARTQSALLATCIAASVSSYVAPARASAPPAQYTVDDTSGTVLDNDTGLVWQRGVPAPAYTWYGALAYCEGLSLAGQTDWRLPTRKELHTIVDVRTYNPPIDALAFPGTPADFFWSSSPNVTYSYSGVWGVDFTQGHGTYHDATEAHRVRCVR